MRKHASIEADLFPEVAVFELSNVGMQECSADDCYMVWETHQFAQRPLSMPQVPRTVQGVDYASYSYAGCDSIWNARKKHAGREHIATWKAVFDCVSDCTWHLKIGGNPGAVPPAVMRDHAAALESGSWIHEHIATQLEWLCTAKL